GLIGMPFTVITPLVSSPAVAVACLAVTSFVLAMPQGLPAAALQVIAPNALRAQLTALYFLIGNMVALGLGPTVYALVTDYVFAGPAKLRYSISVVSAVVMPLGALFGYLALKPYRTSVSRAQEIAAATT